MSAAEPAAPSFRPDHIDRVGEPPYFVSSGDAALERVHAEDRTALQALLEHLRRQSEPTAARLDVRVDDGRGAWRLREAVASNLAAEGGAAIQLQWREVRRGGPAVCSSCASDDRLQLIAEASDDIISVTSGHRQTLYASPALARITGYTLEEIQASDFSGRVHPEDGPLVELARNLNLRGQGTRIEYRYRCKNGEYVWLDSQATPVVGADGNVERIVLNTREITLRKAAERDLQKLEASWRALLSSAPDIVELLDNEGTVLFANRARPGRDIDDVIGSRLTRDLSLEAGRLLRQALRQALATGQPVDFQWEWAPAGHCAVWYWSRIAPLAGADPTERLVMLSRDVTERQRQAQDQAALPAAVQATSQELAGQLVSALDRLTTVGAAFTPGSAADVALQQAQDAIRSATALAGRLAALASPAAAESSHAAPIEEARAAAARPASLLLVDDDDSVRASLLALLRARGVRVVAAADGHTAIDLFAEQAEEIDAVVLDQNMPAMDGSSVLRELRAIRPDIKVVISSGDLMESWDTQLDECNRLAFAQKALGPQELIAQLQRLLGRKL